MPCNNKFKEELDLTHIDYEPTTLIVGTFSPEWPEADMEWFYGKTVKNHFWNVLPRLYGEESLSEATSAEWKNFCSDKKIAITDIISAIDDAEPENKKHIHALQGLSDRGIEYTFEDFNTVNIVHILKRLPTIRNVYFTRGITEAIWRHLWHPAMQYCNMNNLHERRLLAPAGKEPLNQHQVYNQHHPKDHITLLEDYILMRWKSEWRF